MDTELDALLLRARTYSAFADHARHLHTNAELAAVVTAAQRALADGTAAVVTIFDDATGERTEVEPRGSAESVASRLAPKADAPGRPGPGRPRLGVVSREVSLLPRHWEWLGAQPGGASAALRRLVDAARKRGRAQHAARVAQDAAAKALSVLAGDLPGFEEVLRAIYRAELVRLAELMSAWPHDLRSHAQRLIETVAALHALAQQEAATEGTAPPQKGSSHGDVN